MCGSARRYLFAMHRLPIAALAALLLAPGLLSAQGAEPGFMGQGVSHRLAVWRARTIRDVRYDLRLDVTPLDSAIGHVTIRFVRQGGDDAIVDFRGRRLRSATANGRPVPLEGFNGHHLRVPAGLLAAGSNTVAISFVSNIAPSGASIIKVHDPADRTDYLYTLLVPADANQLFPCFDQPDLKARVTLALTTPSQWNALGNGSLARADSAADRTTSHFTETQPLPTYLIAFAAGPWARAASTHNGRTVNILVRRSRAKEADTDTLLALQHRALDWMERYFGSPYPFEKYDMVLAPAFPFGGMEHPGAIMYSEDRFIFRERPTLTRRLGRFSVILHETAHQWFGDLVTMKWFDDLWLKEGFATYLGAKALADLEPGGDAWKTFYQGNKPTAYAVDQTLGTTPLWQQMANLDLAKSAYGAIVYNKAPSVLKQLNYLVGDSAFQRGVRAFLTTHAYSNATWQDLLGAIGRAGNRSLAGFGQNFMLRRGMPVVEVQIAIQNGTIARLALRQRPAQVTMSGPAPWPMRTQVLLAYRDAPPVRIPVTLTAGTTEIVAARGKPAPLFVFPNVDDYGYFLSLLDSASTEALETGALGGVKDGLLRSMLWGALFDQVRDARMDPARYAGLVLRELPREQDEQLVSALMGRLERTVRAYVAPTERELVRREAERVLWAGAIDATRFYGIRRSHLDGFVSLAASPFGTERMLALLSADSAAGEPVRDPTRWDVVERLLTLGAPEAEAALAAQAARDTTPDGRRRRFIAGGARPTAEAKADYFRRYFADAALNEDWASGSLGSFNMLEHERLTLPYLRPALDSLRYIQANRRIFFLGAWLGAFLGGQTGPAALDAVRGFLADNPQLPADLKQKVLQSADELERTVRIRRQ